jgi:hypothetical protein
VKIPFKNKNPPCPYFEVVGKGSLRGAKPLYRNYLPLPFNKGKGIKGIGLLKEELKWVRLVNAYHCLAIATMVYFI